MGKAGPSLTAGMAARLPADDQGNMLAKHLLVQQALRDAAPADAAQPRQPPPQGDAAMRGLFASVIGLRGRNWSY